MSDRRIKAPRTMSRLELTEHLAKFHGDDGPATLWRHNHLHHVAVPAIRHGHRSPLVSEESHADWLVSS